MPQKLGSIDCYKAHDNSKWKIFKKGACIFYICISIAYHLKLMKFVSLQNNQMLPYDSIDSVGEYTVM